MARTVAELNADAAAAEVHIPQKHDFQAFAFQLSAGFQITLAEITRLLGTTLIGERCNQATMNVFRTNPGLPGPSLHDHSTEFKADHPQLQPQTEANTPPKRLHPD